MPNQLSPQPIHHVRESVIPLSIQIFSALLIINSLYAGFLILLFLDTSIIINNVVPSLGFLWFMHVVAFVLQIIAVLKITLSWAVRNYYIAGHHLVETQGIVQADEDIIDLHNLRTVHVHQNWLGRLFNYGDIHITVAASGYRAEIKIDGITNPEQYQRIFRSFLEDSNQPSSHDEIDIHSLISANDKRN